MKAQIRSAALLVGVAAAVLAVASPAQAKGGGAAAVPPPSCAQITGFTNTLGYSAAGRPSISTVVTVQLTCIDERPPTLSIQYRNDLTGKVEFSSATANPVLRPITAGIATSNGSTPYTVIATVEAATGGGKVLDQRSEILTTLPVLVPAA